jgi:hypothetical protein
MARALHAPALVIKPAPAWRVDLGPSRPVGWTDPGKTKDRLVQKPDQTQATRRVNPWPWRTRTRPFFFKCGFSPRPFFSYFFNWLLTLFKIHYINTRRIFYFSMWDLKPFSIYTLCSQEKKLYFQCGIWSLLVYIIYIHKKKNHVFSMWDKKNLV